MAGKRSAATTARYSEYAAKQVWKINRVKKLTRELKRNPSNAEQINAAIKNISYRRHTPKTNQWSKTNKALASMYKKACGSCPHEVFSSNEKVSADAFAKISKIATVSARPVDRVSFSIKDQLLAKGI